MQQNKTVIDVTEFEKFDSETKTLFLYGDFGKNKEPTYFVEWNGKRIHSDKSFSSMKSLFQDIQQVLYDIYDWSYCEECNKMTKDVAQFRIVYTNGTIRDFVLCPNHYSAYCEMRMMDSSDISTITKEEHDLEVFLDEGGT